jgi:hypothetical protein
MKDTYLLLIDAKVFISRKLFELRLHFNLMY